MRRVLAILVVIVLGAWFVMVYRYHYDTYNVSEGAIETPIRVDHTAPLQKNEEWTATTTPPEHDEGKQSVITLSPEHIEILDSFGVDVETVPTFLTPTREACFRNKLGSDRVDQILAGDTPSLSEMVRGKSCIEE